MLSGPEGLPRTGLSPSRPPASRSATRPYSTRRGDWYILASTASLSPCWGCRPSTLPSARGAPQPESESRDQRQRRIAIITGLHRRWRSQKSCMSTYLVSVACASRTAEVQRSRSSWQRARNRAACGSAAHGLQRTWSGRSPAIASRSSPLGQPSSISVSGGSVAQSSISRRSPNGCRDSTPVAAAIRSRRSKAALRGSQRVSRRYSASGVASGPSSPALRRQALRSRSWRPIRSANSGRRRTGSPRAARLAYRRRRASCTRSPPGRTRAATRPAAGRSPQASATRIRFVS